MAELSSELRGFIFRHIDSVSRLEILLRFRARPEEPYTADEVARGLYMDAAAVAGQLSQLESRGFLSRVEGDAGRYRYAPPADVDALVGALSDAYRERRVSVITTIYTAPPDAAQSFAEAFRFRK